MNSHSKPGHGANGKRGTHTPLFASNVILWCKFGNLHICLGANVINCNVMNDGDQGMFGCNAEYIVNPTAKKHPL